MYGRGTTDMKGEQGTGRNGACVCAHAAQKLMFPPYRAGGLVSAYMALKAIYDTGIYLDGDVYFSTVVEEERGGAGVQDSGFYAVW